MASGQKGDLGKQGQGGRGRGLFHAAGEGGDRGKSVAWGAASVIHRAFVRFHVSAAATFCSFPCFFPPFSHSFNKFKMVFSCACFLFSVNTDLLYFILFLTFSFNIMFRMFT